MSSLSEEEENYVRLSLLLTGLSPRAVRALFDKEFPPKILPFAPNQKKNTLLSLPKNRVINQAQWNLMFPISGVADSKTFDVTLMLCLMKNLTSVMPPLFGFDGLPIPGETTPGTDISRIIYYRNYLAHLDNNNKIDNCEFETAWVDISDAVGRLGGSAMSQECQGLKTKSLDQSNFEICLEIKTCMREVVNLKNELENQEERQKLKTGHELKAKDIDKLTDPVPWNVRVYEEEINKLRTENEYGKYCALALCIMFNNHLQEEWLTEDVNQEIQQIIENTCEACRLNRGTSRLVLRNVVPQ